MEKSGGTRWGSAVLKGTAPGRGRGERPRHPGLGEGADLTLASRSIIGAGFALPRGADRRSAFQAVPALLRRQRYAVPPACGARCRPEIGVPSRPRAFFAVGDTRFRPPAARGADRRSAFQAVPALLRGQRYAVPPACGARCRPEVGVPSRPRASSRSAVRGSARLRRAVPTGGRRSKPFPRFFAVGDAVPPACGARCRPEVGVPSRPRASSPSAIRGSARLRRARYADRRSAFQAVPALLRGRRTAVRCLTAVPSGSGRRVPPPCHPPGHS